MAPSAAGVGGFLSSMVPHPRHGLTIGALLMVSSAFGVYGSVTGRLPAMIAAIFYPNLLQTTSGGATPTTIPLTNKQSAAEDLTAGASQTASNPLIAFGDTLKGIYQLVYSKL